MGEGKGVERTRRRTIGERKSDDDDDFNPLRLSFDIVTILDKIPPTTHLSQLKKKTIDKEENQRNLEINSSIGNDVLYFFFLTHSTRGMEENSSSFPWLAA